MSRIEDLPDYPAIREIAHALWRSGEARGAAVMVGAGFSRFARLPAADANPAPLWTDFAVRMLNALGYARGQGGAPDALRLAEEYRSEFGQPRLEGLVRELVRNDRWTPGEHHERLVRLPWSDILTTNWDTLLERAAADDPDLDYEPVMTEGDIARTRAPRIVKLHGTFPQLTPFIFTEEDFRTYPTRHAPFVNLAQQVLLENELCLLGFSGDDPNFLAWSGWVRDHLGPAARRIHLVGVLGLPPSQRRMLEARNVSVIDLAPLAADLDAADRHEAAAGAFLKALEDAQPAEPWLWSCPEQPLKDDAPVAEVVERWRSERASYPGWLLAPNIERQRIRRETLEVVPGLEQTVDAKAPLAVGLLVELAWRCETSLLEFPAGLVETARTIMLDTGIEAERADRFTIGLAAARHDRLARDHASFECTADALERYAASAEQKATLAYERALSAREALDHDRVEALESAVAAADPIWKARRAALLTTLGRDEEAARLIREALAEVRLRRARDRKSLWLLSREAWVRFHRRLSWASSEDRDPADALGEWPGRFAEARCDPWDEMQSWDVDLERARQRAEKRSTTEEILYDPGMRRLHDHNHGWIAAYILEPHDELRALLDRTGTPLSRNDATISTRLERAATLLPVEDKRATWAALIAVRERKGGLIDARFGRMAVARMPAELVSELAIALRRSVDFGRSRLWSPRRAGDDHERHTSWVEIVRRHLELLSRLSVRLSAEEAETLLGWGLEVAADQNWRHWWLFEGTSALIERIFTAIPPDRRALFAGAMLELPLAAEKDAHGILERWPELAEVVLPHADRIARPPASWDRRISDLIDRARSDKLSTRTSALIRLLPLSVAGLLTATENERLAQATWSRRSDTQALPTDTTLLPHAFLQLPEPQTGEAAKAFRTDVVGRLAGKRPLEGDWRTLASASRPPYDFRLTPEEGAELLDVIVEVARAPQARLGGDVNRGTLGFALADAILPIATLESLTPDRIEGLLEAAAASPGLMLGLPRLATFIRSTSQAGTDLIRRTMRSNDGQVASFALFAVIRWSTLSLDGGPQLPRELAADVVHLCSTRRGASLKPALEAAARLVADGHTTPEDHHLLEEALENLLAETAYDNPDPGAVPAHERSLVRRNCVRLAARLEEMKPSDVAARWLREAPEDALPEVRFATLDEQ